MVQLILRESVEDLGEAGEVVDVAPGYARNYLLPQGLAYEATESNLSRLQQQRRRRERAVERQRERAGEVGRQLDGTSVTFSERAGEEGRLFGSVSAADIAGRLQEEGHPVEPDQVDIDEPIKELGVYTVGLALHDDVRPEVKVWVVAEE